MWPAGLTCLLLAGAAAYNGLTHVSAADAEPYHERVRAASERIPTRVGDWVGTDEPIVKEAVELLKPNVIFNRRYYNARTGETASLLLVQCRDARDMIGHYPPICYVAHGWSLSDSKPEDLAAGRLKVPVTHYTFTTGAAGGSRNLEIDNFMVMPGGAMERDMDGVRAAERHRGQRPFGAAQFQVVTFDPTMTERRRAEIFDELVGAASDAIGAIRSGGSQ